ncbi:MAG: hypothetical protein ACYCOU_03080 [Sulfobacillus sp.]
MITKGKTSLVSLSGFNLKKSQVKTIFTLIQMATTSGEEMKLWKMNDFSFLKRLIQSQSQSHGYEF